MDDGYNGYNLYLGIHSGYNSCLKQDFCLKGIRAKKTPSGRNHDLEDFGGCSHRLNDRFRYPLFLGLLQAPSPTALPAAFVADGWFGTVQIWTIEWFWSPLMWQKSFWIKGCSLPFRYLGFLTHERSPVSLGVWKDKGCSERGRLVNWYDLFLLAR